MNQLRNLFIIYRPFSTSFRKFTEQNWKIEKSLISSSVAIDPQKLPEKTKIDGETIELLEKLSLVDCASEEGIETLEAAIQFADQILQIDVIDNEPLVTLLEDIPLQVREDKVSDGNYKKEVLRNASVTEDGYFVTPPGNVTLEEDEKSPRPAIDLKNA